MNELIKINFEEQTVSARDLHERVGSTERFANWFERQLQYGFEEGTDYVGCKTFNTQAHQELQDYVISMEMAKEICMIQRNERAREIRKYLVKVEEAWNKPEVVMARALKMANNQIAELKDCNQKLLEDTERMKPKEIFADAVSTSKTSILVGDLAKLISQNGVEIGQIRLFDYLRNNGYLMKNGTSRNLPTQKYMEMGLFEIKESTVQNPDGSVRINRTTKVTGKGQIYFVNKFLKERN